MIHARVSPEQHDFATQFLTQSEEEQFCYYLLVVASKAVKKRGPLGRKACFRTWLNNYVRKCAE
jgi:hypothetical protein